MEASEIRQWTETVLLPAVDPARPLPDGDAPLPGGGLALLSADTDRTQAYVFQSARLPEIRGASMLLDSLNDRLPALFEADDIRLSAKPITADEPGCLIYSGGGSLLALAPVSLAPTLADRIEALYPQESGTATITAVWQSITIAEARGLLPTGLSQTAAAGLDARGRRRLAGSLGLNATQRLMCRQATALRAHKHARAFAPFVEANPYARRCQSCGERPALTVLSGIPDEEPRYLCRVCHRNDRRGRNNKSSWNTAFERWVLKTHDREIEAPPNQDLQEIGESADGYIGFIYADGNGIGRLLEAAANLRAYSALSTQLATATTGAVYQALYSHLFVDDKMLPFEIITIGGDDVLLIVPANRALPIARDICAHFAAGLANQAGTPTMSAGVVIAQQSNPIYFLSDLAGQLLKSAKKRTAAEAETRPACVDFMVLKSQSTVATRLEDVRRSAYLQTEDQLQKERCYLTGRPYTLPELDRLLADTAALRGIVAPGQIHQMRREFQKGRFPAIFYYLYQRTRLGNAGDSAARRLGEMELAWGMADPDEAPPWIPLGQAADGFSEYKTPWLDMLTLRDFVPETDETDD